MVKITEQLIRKKSEHNELMIGTLEELSLHQEDIEKIEHVHDWCRDLKILLMQSNLISKIENLNKLKKLEYLNLALNNVERVENLEGLESLQKLDLTLNFVGELTSVESLTGNYNLEEMFMTGNPCTDYKGYREYVISVLPQLKVLDGTDITRTERLKALKVLDENRKRIIQYQAEYQISRDEQKRRVQGEIDQLSDVNLDDEVKLKEFWDMKSEHCPEMRYEMAKHSKRAERQKNANDGKASEVKFKPKMFAECGRPYSLNQPKLTFTLKDERDRFELDLHVYKYLDTSLLDVDVQANYVRVTVKTKIFQMALNEEVKIDESSSQRSMITGHLLIKMPKLNPKHVIAPHSAKIAANTTVNEHSKLKGTVNLRSIVQPHIDESEIPPLV